MFFKFRDFIDNLARETNFDRMDMGGFFRKEIQSKVLLIRSYKSIFQDSWDKWQSKRSGSDVAAFFKSYGKDLLTSWLCKVFPFTDKQLRVHFDEGGTNVDIILKTEYTYTAKETKFVEKVLNKKNIKDINKEIALIRALAETILSFPLIWTEYFGYEFTIMPENEEKSWRKGDFYLQMDFSARPSY